MTLPLVSTETVLPALSTQTTISGISTITYLVTISRFAGISRLLSATRLEDDHIRRMPASREIYTSWIRERGEKQRANGQKEDSGLHFDCFSLGLANVSGSWSGAINAKGTEKAGAVRLALQRSGKASRTAGISDCRETQDVGD
jgi:hypothetical protein